MTVLDPNAVYTIATAAKALGLPEKCISVAIRSGELTASRRGRFYFITAYWLRAWIESGKIDRRDREQETRDILEFERPDPAA